MVEIICLASTTTSKICGRIWEKG